MLKNLRLGQTIVIASKPWRTLVEENPKYFKEQQKEMIKEFSSRLKDLGIDKENSDTLKKLKESKTAKDFLKAHDTLDTNITKHENKIESFKNSNKAPKRPTDNSESSDIKKVTKTKEAFDKHKKDSDDWFSGLSKQRQQEYIKLHPNSKHAKK